MGRCCGVNCGIGACVFLIIPLCLVGIPLFVVFYGGLHGLYPMDIRGAIAIYLGAINIVTFLTYAVDKVSSASFEDSSIRVPEIVLLSLAWVGGPIGAFLGVCCCNHKGSKGGFIALLSIISVFNWLWVFIYYIATAKTSLSGAFDHTSDGNNPFVNHTLNITD